MTRPDQPRRAYRSRLVIAVGVLAAGIKIVIALTTLGTNDVIGFYQFAKAIETHGLVWIYDHSILFNHPPLVGYSLRGLIWLSHLPSLEQLGISFPFLLRLPGIVADFGVVLVLLFLGREYPQLRPPTWAHILFAASPVSLMISGFHGNTDPILVFFLVLASVAAVRGRPSLCGILLALSCQIKIVPLLLLPVFFFYWIQQRGARWFLLSFAAGSLLFCLEPLLMSPGAFGRNVLGYGSFWGIWGLTYCLRMTGLHDFSRVNFLNLSPIQQLIVAILKVAIVLAILVLGWRRRKLSPPEIFASLGYAWLIFFVLSPGIAAQYLVWLAPFVLLMSPSFYALLVTGSAIFLFAFYTLSSGGFPWYSAHATSKLNLISAHWALVPWLTLVGGLIVLGWNARQQHRHLRFLSLTPIEPVNTVE
ncbi:MAG TPA: glycosyltransferase 87 family protein [Chthoniobacterales bacterium]|nr:glycosyltransferase 87 family protein [Chthoniobacterales bacterium]